MTLGFIVYRLMKSTPSGRSVAEGNLLTDSFCESSDKQSSKFPRILPKSLKQPVAG